MSFMFRKWERVDKPNLGVNYLHTYHLLIYSYQLENELLTLTYKKGGHSGLWKIAYDFQHGL